MSDKKDFNKKYEKKISSLQIDLVRMQEWVIAEKKKLVIIFVELWEAQFKVSREF